MHRTIKSTIILTSTIILIKHFCLRKFEKFTAVKFFLVWTIQVFAKEKKVLLVLSKANYLLVQKKSSSSLIMVRL